MMGTGEKKPCASCPYRKDAPIGMWHPEEFENLLANDADPVRGGVFGCHKYRFRPMAERQFCAGWVLDQRRRGNPSIQLRLAMLKNHELLDDLESIGDGGLDLYRSIPEMCEANGVTRARRRGEGVEFDPEEEDE